MSASTYLKALIGGIAVATAAFAIAQGTPPRAGTADPATGAGQRSSQNTPMGTTGTPGGGGATAQGGTSSGTAAGTGSTTGSTAGSTSGSTAAGSSMNSGSTAGSSMSGSGSGGGSSMAASDGSSRRARADRN